MIEVLRKMIVTLNRMMRNKESHTDAAWITEMVSFVCLMSDLVALGSTAFTVHQLLEQVFKFRE